MSEQFEAKLASLRAIDTDVHNDLPSYEELKPFLPRKWHPWLDDGGPGFAARVCLGRVMGTTLPSDVYEFKYGEEGRILRCPWHSWEYDIRTGESVFDKSVRVVRYQVEISDGDVAVTI